MNLSRVIEDLVEERGLDRSLLNSIICEGIAAAYNKKYPQCVFDVSADAGTGEVEVKVQKTVVSSVEDDDIEISLRKARSVDPDVKVGDEIWVPFEDKIGRIEVLKAKQVIAQRIREVEASALYNEFKDKQGTIVHGVIHKCERGGATVKVGDNLAFLPRSLSIPTDKCIVGLSIRALLKEVLPEPRNDNQLILDRSSTDFVRKLFELEIPEIFERLVEIKSLVRSPGYKTKIVVTSHDNNIDPVGTCVGVGGVRIKPILKELGTEKIDIIPASDSLEKFVADALKPATINKVELSKDEKVANVWLDEDQRSLAIGKGGQNIALASKLTGVDIQLVQSEKSEVEEDQDIFTESEEESDQKDSE